MNREHKTMRLIEIDTSVYSIPQLYCSTLSISAGCWKESVEEKDVVFDYVLYSHSARHMIELFMALKMVLKNFWTENRNSEIWL